ncbi:SGNH/GDSL hydrolase family protein [Ruegeria sp.]|uniref:SGNH/GDSL hydrolase family protein n=1 Tax=Ruegeria sp. TaxID=1879320 RepID=UPI003C7C5505
MATKVTAPYENLSEAFPYEEPDYSVYDPFLGYSKKSNAIPGYDIWPPGEGFKDKDIVILTIGGSTTDFGSARWPAFLGEILISQGVNTVILNGGVAGYSSSQELIKVLRDLPSIKPDIVVSLSGINDFTWGHTRPEFPLLHSYQRRVAEYLCESTDAFDDWVGGIPHRSDKSEVWLRNIRLMRALCTDADAQILCCLQPTMVYGNYHHDEIERKNLLEPFASKYMNDGDIYRDVAIDFYNSVRSHLQSQPDIYAHCCDLSFLFDGKVKLYRDYRHQNEAGDRVLAQAIAREMGERFDIKGLKNE